ncbi:hypothetical protein FRC12_024946 [Ceratobasidium sp. 428]|nr:hypothetical protein FRC12_024946 [Ceratobasidium sp. 428]
MIVDPKSTSGNCLNPALSDVQPQLADFAAFRIPHPWLFAVYPRRPTDVIQERIEFVIGPDPAESDDDPLSLNTPSTDIRPANWDTKTYSRPVRPEEASTFWNTSPKPSSRHQRLNLVVFWFLLFQGF